MPLKPPKYIETSGIIGAPIKYQWNSDLGLKFFAAKDLNIRMHDAINASNFKAKMGLAIAISEWIIWRFDGHANLNDAHNRIEAAWASVIDPLYSKELSLQMTKDDNVAPVEGPLELALCLLGKIHGRYCKGNIYLAAPIVNLAMLARHLMPDKKAFDSWLSTALRRAAQVFPRGVTYDRKTGTYDASHEKPVPREFFDPNWVYTEAAAEAALRAFLQTLDPKQNPYLRTPEEMKAAGFKGTPYSL
jgi:hypothetical protein